MIQALNEDAASKRAQTTEIETQTTQRLGLQGPYPGSSSMAGSSHAYPHGNRLPASGNVTPTSAMQMNHQASMMASMNYQAPVNGHHTLGMNGHPPPLMNGSVPRSMHPSESGFSRSTMPGFAPRQELNQQALNHQARRVKFEPCPPPPGVGRLLAAASA